MKVSLDTAIESFRSDDDAHLPVCFSVRSEEAEQLRQALGQNEVKVVDTIEVQIAEWVRTQTSAAASSPQEQAARVAKILWSAGAKEALGVWVFFGWRRTAVHLLEPTAFHAVRTNRNQLKITRTEQAALRGKRIGVVGLSVGHAAALALAQEGICGELRLADHDRLELSNLNRLRTSLCNLGELKWSVAAREVAEIDPFLAVRAFPEGLHEGNIDAFFEDGGPLDLVVEECDSLDIKIRVREKAKALGIPVVMDTNDRGMLDIERFDLEPDRPLLHGMLGDMNAATAASLNSQGRAALFADFIGGIDNLSPRMQASLPRIGLDLVSYPQLASGVSLGAALVAHAAREVLLGRDAPSGRYHVDLGSLFCA